jgi:hypothetical protein
MRVRDVGAHLREEPDRKLEIARGRTPWPEGMDRSWGRPKPGRQKNRIPRIRVGRDATSGGRACQGGSRRPRSGCPTRRCTQPRRAASARRLGGRLCGRRCSNCQRAPVVTTYGCVRVEPVQTPGARVPQPGLLPAPDWRVKRDLVRAERAGGGLGQTRPLGPRYLLGLPKLQKAIKQGTKVISEAELLNLLGQ